MTISTKWIRVGNIACAVLLLALLALQAFQPFWTMPACICTEECTKSINEVLKPSEINLECPACKGYARIKNGKTPVVPIWCKARKLNSIEAKQVSGIDSSKEWTVTIQQYAWMPTFASTVGVTEYFRSLYDDYSPYAGEYDQLVALGGGSEYTFRVKDMVLMPVIVFFFGLIGGYLCLFKSKNPLCSIFPLVTGIWVVKDYLTLHVFQIGKWWQIHMGIGIALIAFALIPTAAYILRAIKWLNPKAAE